MSIFMIILFHSFTIAQNMPAVDAIHYPPLRDLTLNTIPMMIPILISFSVVMVPFFLIWIKATSSTWFISSVSSASFYLSGRNFSSKESLSGERKSLSGKPTSIHWSGDPFHVAWNKWATWKESYPWKLLAPILSLSFFIPSQYFKSLSGKINRLPLNN